MRECKIDQSTEDGVCLIRLDGALDAYSFPNFESALNDLREDENNRIIIDCEGLEYISSVAIGAMLGFTRKARESGGDMVLVNLAPKVHHVIELLGFNRFLGIHEDIAAGRQALKG